MAVIILMVGLISVMQSEGYAEFKANSNNNSEYAFIWAVPCDQGLSSSGYALAPTGLLFLKQVNLDGSVGPVCTK